VDEVHTVTCHSLSNLTVKIALKSAAFWQSCRQK